MSVAENVKRLEKQLLLDKHALDEAALYQPSLYHEVAELEANATSRRDKAKQVMEEEEAKASARLRKVYAEEKMTEGRLREMVTIDPRFKEAQQEYLGWKFKVDKVSALKSAFEQRASMLKVLANLYVANYFTTDSIKGGKTGELAYEAAREQQRVARSRKTVNRKQE